MTSGSLGANVVEIVAVSFRKVQQVGRSRCVTIAHPTPRKSEPIKNALNIVDPRGFHRLQKRVFQIANYLKSHGAGLFGLIVSRKRGDTAGCEVTLREHWLVHRKLIVVLDDADIEAMLVAKSDGRPPEELIGSKIEQFRLSM